MSTVKIFFYQRKLLFFFPFTATRDTVYSRKAKGGSGGEKIVRRSAIGEKEVPPKAMKPKFLPAVARLTSRVEQRLIITRQGGSRLRDTIRPAAQNVSERGVARKRHTGTLATLIATIWQEPRQY